MIDGRLDLLDVINILQILGAFLFNLGLIVTEAAIVSLPVKLVDCILAFPLYELDLLESQLNVLLVTRFSSSLHISFERS